MKPYYFLLLVLFTQCTKGTDPSPSASASGVYVVGYTFNASRKMVAEYWKDGKAVTLTNGQGNATTTGIAVSGSDVYVCGSDDFNSAFPYWAKYWKDGKELSVSTDCLAIKAIATSGTDLLMLGLSTSGWVYWKNGTPVTIIDTTSFQVNTLATSGSDVYVSGYSEPAGLLTVRNATCLKNGSIVFRAPSPSYAMSVAVSGSDVYLAGYIPGNDVQHNTAVYWKNGVAVTLTDGTTNAMAYSILVSGSDVYAVGAENKVACYWKNGVKVNLGDGSAVSEAFSMAIKGSAIHAAGYLGSHPCWWVNGTAQSLEGGTADGAALQVVVN